jgi:uncharacterized membrane protein YbhN (UPF0104 family)
VGSYATLTGFDWLGARYAGSKLSYRRIALASFLSLAIGHTVGFAPFSSGAIRYRFYSRWGLSNEQIGMIILFSVVTVTLGEATLSAIVLLTHGMAAQKILRVGPGFVEIIGGVASMIVIGYFASACFLRRAVTIFGRRFAFPSPRLALTQIGIGLLNYVFVAGALHFLLSTAPMDFFTTTAAYILGSLAALLSHVPGGIGVLEGTIVLLLPNIDAIGPLIAFRCLYFLMPLGIGLVTLAIVELRTHTGNRREQCPRHAPP